MTATYLTTDLSELAEYATFEQQLEMDEAIYAYIETLQMEEEPQSVIEVLRFLGRSSLRVLGVSFAKYQTIADSCDVSKSTVMRAIKRLDHYGMIERFPTVKKWFGKAKRKSVNIIRINRAMTTQGEHAEVEVETTDDKDEQNEKQSEPIKHNHTIQEHKRDGESSINPRALRQSIPSVIYEALSSFYDVHGLYEVYGTLLKAKASVNREITLEEHGEAYVDVFLNAVRKYKRGAIGKLNGYLYAAWQSVTSEVSRKLEWGSVNMQASVYYDWLSD
ncbi:hypothetical protein ACFFGV_18145 [Pontibacillus salicampi]|uniref:Helix-turn-helix domain-containing protein n=1 Tax=Pontibacillus salicampi TaxID=1449801 RepID=A0ABV6LTD2_9BACI